MQINSIYLTSFLTMEVPPSVASGADSGDDQYDYDQAKEVLEFDETKAGVKGLMDSGIVHLPRFFIQPLEHRVVLPSEGSASIEVQVPVIDFRGGEGGEIVEEIRRAIETWGFFQLVNHGVPESIMEELLEGNRRFHEQPTEVKRVFYSRDPKKRVRFFCNGDLLVSKVAKWRDSVSFEYHDSTLDPEEIPQVCRKAVCEYMEQMLELREKLCRVLSAALGLSENYLSSIKCMKTATLLCHYYPACPEPDLTIGAIKHSDPSFLTILLQDTIGGLQVFHQNQWVDVPPTEGALIVNIGDLMQHLTNDKLRSVEHRVVAGRIGPRASAACFFYPSTDRECKSYGPAKEFVSDNNLPNYREITFREFMAYHRAKGQDGKPTLPHFRLQL
ncbi:hypothetical protein Ancab_022424 [Ancistrocladus abbreviatus]